jgi:hypothetical protein
MSGEQQVFRALWSWRYWLLMWVGVATVISIAVVIQYPPLYRSTTHLYVNARNVAGERIEGQFELPPPEVRKVFFLATSTEVLDHVLDKLKLVDEQPKVGALSKVRARYRLLKALDVRVVEGNGITISVSHKDRDLAPRIANEVYRKVVQIVEKGTIRDMDRSMRIHQRVFKGLEEQAGKFERSLIRVLDSTKVLRADPERQMRLDLEFDRLLGQMSRTQQEMANIHRVQLVSAGLLRKEFSDPITLIRKADPDLSMNPLWDAILRVLLLLTCATVVVMAVMTLWASKRAEVLHQWRLLKANDGPGGDEREVEPVLDDLLDRSFRRAAPSSIEARSGSEQRV